MPLLRRVPSVLLVALLLVLSASCGHRAYRVVTRPADRAANPLSGAPIAPRRDPIGKLHAVRAALTALTTTTTSAPPTTAARLVVPPGQQPRPETGDYHLWPDWPLWRALGRCEEGGGPAPDGIHWDHNGSSYVSGFGMARSTFDMDAHAVGLPAWHVGYPPADQIRVARYGHYVRHQHWGCGVRVTGW